MPAFESSVRSEATYAVAIETTGRLGNTEASSAGTLRSRFTNRIKVIARTDETIRVELTVQVDDSRSPQPGSGLHALFRETVKL